MVWRWVIKMKGFGLAEIKAEGRMRISKEAIEDDVPLPMLPPAYLCKDIQIVDKIYTRKEYALLYIQDQKYF